MPEERCSHCNNLILPYEDRCHHCALPGLFPNVRAANEKEEKEALQKRYEDAVKDSTLRDCNKELKAFEASLIKSEAVIARSNLESVRLATEDNELYASYYELFDAKVRIPKGDIWDVFRQVADAAVFPSYAKDIRFAVLSLNEKGSSNYGENFWVLDEKMISHRTTVFTENTTLFMDTHSIKMDEVDKLPKGHRAVWDERAKLCVAKLNCKLSKGMNLASFQKILLEEGKTSATDSFIEVHVWGPISIRTIKKMIMRKPKGRVNKLFAKATLEKLKALGIAAIII